MRISDWSSDVCSSDLPSRPGHGVRCCPHTPAIPREKKGDFAARTQAEDRRDDDASSQRAGDRAMGAAHRRTAPPRRTGRSARSEEHTSELQSLMRISYAVFCLKTTIKQHKTTTLCK